MVLGVSRKDDPNAWGLPGGKVEEKECRCVDYFGVSKDVCPDCRGSGRVAAETEDEAARREFREETGVTLYQQFGATCALVEVFRREGGVTFMATQGMIFRIEATKETGRVAWVTWQQLFDGPFGDYNRKLAAHIGVK